MNEEVKEIIEANRLLDENIAIYVNTHKAHFGAMVDIIAEDCKIPHHEAFNVMIKIAVDRLVRYIAKFLPNQFQLIYGDGDYSMLKVFIEKALAEYKFNEEE